MVEEEIRDVKHENSTRDCWHLRGSVGGRTRKLFKKETPKTNSSILEVGSSRENRAQTAKHLQFVAD